MTVYALHVLGSIRNLRVLSFPQNEGVVFAVVPFLNKTTDLCSVQHCWYIMVSNTPEYLFSDNSLKIYVPLTMNGLKENAKMSVQHFCPCNTYGHLFLRLHEFSANLNASINYGCPRTWTQIW